LFWLLALAGWLYQIKNTSTQPIHRTFVIAFVIASFISICPGFFFRQHYFILLLPAISLMFGYGVFSIADVLLKKIHQLKSRLLVAGALVVATIATLLFQEKQILFELPPSIASHIIYGENPFPESQVLADSLQKWTKKDDKVAILGSEPQIFFYSHRRSASKFIYTYALVEKQPFASSMQKEMIREIETAKPEYIVFVNIYRSWLFKKGCAKEILAWFQKYQKDHYQIIGRAEILQADKTMYIWRKQAEEYNPQSSNWLAVFKCNDCIAK
jgi:hypothetical protein